jgi:hypothetical protein
MSAMFQCLRLVTLVQRDPCYANEAERFAYGLSVHLFLESQPPPQMKWVLVEAANVLGEQLDPLEH